LSNYLKIRQKQQQKHLQWANICKTQQQHQKQYPFLEHHQAVRQPFKRKTILSWLLDCKIIRVGGLVQYRTNLNGTKTYELVTGLICNRAITCECCGDKISIWNFEKHLASNRGQPCDHITIPKNSTSTLTCIIDCIVLSWDNPEEQNRHSITWAGRVTYGIETSQMSSMARNSKKKVSFHKLCKSNLHPYMKHYFKITFTNEA